MSRLKLISIIVLTALVSCALTSAFWFAAFNRGQIAVSGAAVPHPATAAAAPGDGGAPHVAAGGPLVLGPTGLAIPVAGVKTEQLSDTFTQARSGGRVHDAIDIMAPHGTPVVSAAPGTVEKLFFSNGGGGITVYVRAPDQLYTFYYAHLQSYAPGLHEGQVVKQGDPIGLVGSTGNANPAGPHLHFAIHRMAPSEKWYQGQAINPYPLLAGKKPGS
ncbi:MAG TPA: M23 family metallopeptidase [Allosphingosinicella sp.]|jgi:murein DD-endopeptidase MepM/ murein hydrolase activator NlpD